MTKRNLSTEAASQICTISASMVGVCLTTIGLIRVVITLKQIDTFADNILAFDAVIFLIATITSYWAMRHRHETRLHLLEKIADIAFMSGIIVMTIACVFIAFAMTIR
ncbi:MAG: hypothetical protein JWO78_644 [Micavibrio sp.]|nr:hypothetical protein [Micavibrio sp.]